MLFIENVGNLVCPASYDLGEAEENIRAVSPNIEIVHTSAKRGTGMDRWLAFLLSQLVARPPAAVEVS